MIDPLYRQQLRDQVDVVRELLSEMLTQAALIDLLTDPSDRERVIEAGLRVSEAALQIDELTAELCDTAARFDLVALQDSAGRRSVVSRSIARLWPWLPIYDSVGDPWVWDREDAIERGYCDEETDDHLIGVVGFEDAVYLFDETSQPCMYARLEELQAELDRLDAKLLLEPHYSFLWRILHDPERATTPVPGEKDFYDDAIPF